MNASQNTESGLFEPRVKPALVLSIHGEEGGPREWKPMPFITIREAKLSSWDIAMTTLHNRIKRTISKLPEPSIEAKLHYTVFLGISLQDESFATFDRVTFKQFEDWPTIVDIMTRRMVLAGLLPPETPYQAIEYGEPLKGGIYPGKKHNFFFNILELPGQNIPERDLIAPRRC